jgi:hypothetical protein
MEKVFRNYENQVKRVNKTYQNWGNAAGAYQNALNVFARKYHINPNNQNNMKFYSLIKKHPNIKQNHLKLMESVRVHMIEQNKLKNLQRKVEHAFHIPRNERNEGVRSRNLLQLIRNEKQRVLRQNKARMISLLKEKNIPVNLIRHMFPNK